MNQTPALHHLQTMTFDLDIHITISYSQPSKWFPAIEHDLAQNTRLDIHIVHKQALIIYHLINIQL